MRYNFFRITFSFLLFCVIDLKAQTVPQQIHLWANGAPGFENRKDEPEITKEYWIENIHNPSITVFLPPKEKATGVGVIICPGGGFKQIIFDNTGKQAAEYFNKLGIAAFVLKYRLPKENNSPYTLENVKQDAYRAMRLVRSRASEWGIDTTKLGMMGFSAGGEVVSTVAYDNLINNPNAKDPIDRFNPKPNFQILIFPGPLGIPDSVSTDAPPTFLLVSNNDVCCSESVIKLLRTYRKAKVSVEAHIYAVGNHGFGMGNNPKFSQYFSIKHWPDRLTDWLYDTKILIQN